MKITDSSPATSLSQAPVRTDYPCIDVARALVTIAPHLSKAVRESVESLPLSPAQQQEVATLVGKRDVPIKTNWRSLLGSPELVDISQDGTKALFMRGLVLMCRDLRTDAEVKLSHDPFGRTPSDSTFVQGSSQKAYYSVYIGHSGVGDLGTIVDTATGERVTRLDDIENLLSSPDLRLYASLDRYGDFGKVADVLGGSLRGRTYRDSSTIASLTSSGRLAVVRASDKGDRSLGDRKHVVVSDLHSRLPMTRLPHEATTLAFSPDERYLAVVEDQCAFLYDAQSFKKLFSYPCPAGSTLTWSRGSQVLAIGSDLVDVVNHRPLAKGMPADGTQRLDGKRRLVESMGTISLLAFSRNPWNSQPPVLLAEVTDPRRKSLTADIARDVTLQDAIAAYRRDPAAVTPALAELIKFRAEQYGPGVVTDILNTIARVDQGAGIPPYLQTLAHEAAKLDGNARGPIAATATAVGEDVYLPPATWKCLGHTEADAGYAYGIAAQKNPSNRAHLSQLAQGLSTLFDDAAHTNWVWPAPEKGREFGFVAVDPLLPYPAALEEAAQQSSKRVVVLRRVAQGTWLHGEVAALTELGALPTRHLKRLAVRVGMASHGIPKQSEHPLHLLRQDIHKELSYRRQRAKDLRDIPALVAQQSPLNTIEPALLKALRK